MALFPTAPSSPIAAGISMAPQWREVEKAPVPSSRFNIRLFMDAVEVRRKNFIESTAFPHATATGLMYDSGDYETTMDKALAIIDYPALRKRQAELRQQGRYLGIGVSTYVEVCGMGSMRSPLLLPCRSGRNSSSGRIPCGRSQAIACPMRKVSVCRLCCSSNRRRAKGPPPRPRFRTPFSTPTGAFIRMTPSIRWICGVRIFQSSTARRSNRNMPPCAEKSARARKPPHGKSSRRLRLG